MRVLVTGAGGFLGRHLCKGLRASGADIFAIGRSSSAARGYVDHFIEADVAPNCAKLAEILIRYRPDALYHLAGCSAASSLHDFYETNLFYAARLLQACRGLANAPKIVIAGSAAEYGRPLATDRLMNERDMAQPLDAYGETKLAQTVHAMRQSDLPVIVARIFNPIGEGLPAGRAAGRFIERAKALKPLGGGVIETGPLDGVRDIADATEVSAALIDLMVKDLPTGEIYNVCTGKGTRMRDIADALEAIMPYEVIFKPVAGDRGVDWSVGDAGKLAAQDIVVRAPDLHGILARMLSDISDVREERIG